MIIEHTEAFKEELKNRVELPEIMYRCPGGLTCDEHEEYSKIYRTLTKDQQEMIELRLDDARHDAYLEEENNPHEEDLNEGLMNPWDWQ